jgi:cytochrome c oxidase cbb3-type subunit IV
MDINTLRTIMTLVFFLVFVLIVLWAYARRNKSGFDEMARLPLAADESGRAGDE